MKQRVRGRKPFHDDCYFVIVETLSPYQLDKLLYLCTEVMWDDSVSTTIFGYRVNKVDWYNFIEMALSESMCIIPKRTC